MLDTVLIKFLFYTKCLLLFEVVWNKYLFLAVDDEIKDFFGDLDLSLNCIKN